MSRKDGEPRRRTLKQVIKEVEEHGDEIAGSRLEDELGRGAESPGGIECPKCGCRDMKVLWTRPGHGRVRRRRQCRHCKKLLTTYEKGEKQ